MDVYKRDLDANADLKSKNARQFFSEVRKRHGPWPFAIRSFEDELMARAGTQECISQNIIAQYPIVEEKAGDFVAQFQWTVLISAKRTILLTSHMLDEATVKAEGEITDQGMKDLLAVNF
jgi:methionine aminopeptidase